MHRGGDRDACPRCGGVVFEAEKAATSSKGNPFHAKCLTCAACAKRLDPGSVCAGPGADPGTIWTNPTWILILEYVADNIIMIQNVESQFRAFANQVMCC